MLNVGYKKEALGKLEKIKKSYEEKLKGTMESVGFLHNRKIESTIILKRIEDYIMMLRNRPYEYEKEIEKVRIRRQRFETDLKKLEIESKKFDKVSGSEASSRTSPLTK